MSREQLEQHGIEMLQSLDTYWLKFIIALVEKLRLGGVKCG